MQLTAQLKPSIAVQAACNGNNVKHICAAKQVTLFR